MKWRWGNSEHIQHEIGQWVDPMHAGGARDHVFYGYYQITTFDNGQIVNHCKVNYGLYSDSL